MAPVFAYRWQLWLFVATMALLLAFPFVHKPAWMDRSVLYRSMSLLDTHRYNVMPQFLRSERDIDILFVGASAVGSGFDPHIVRDALREKLGREPLVYTLYHPKCGADLDYIMIKDILERRHVKLMVWEALRAQCRDDRMHSGSNYLWDYALHREVMDAPTLDKTYVVLFSMMNSLKLILSPILDLQGKSFTEWRFLCDRGSDYGACLRRHGIERMEPPPVAPEHELPMEKVLHYRQQQDDDLLILRQYNRSTQLFYETILNEAQAKGTKVAITQVPMTEDGKNIVLHSFHSGHPANSLPVLAIPRGYLFPTKKELKQYFMPGDRVHFSIYGSQYHTRAILPALLHLYDEAVKGEAAH